MIVHTIVGLNLKMRLNKIDYDSDATHFELNKFQTVCHFFSKFLQQIYWLM